jgi:copper chaperone CopZ
MKIRPVNARMALFLLIVSGCVLASEAKATEPSRDTIMTVKEMCGGCVKKITKRLDEVEGINDVRCDTKKKTVTVRPKDGFVLDPRRLWEVMDEIGKEPIKLTGPGGTFTSKPNS